MAYLPKFFDTFQALINAGIDVKSRPGMLDPLIALTTNHLTHLGYFLMARLLIESGCCVNGKDDRGRTALIIISADYYGSKLYELVRLLVERGADASVRDNDGLNAVNYLEQRHFLGSLGISKLFTVLIGI